MGEKIKTHHDSVVYRMAFETTMGILFKAYDEVISIIVSMINTPDKWTIK